MQPPTSFLSTMEEYVRDAPRAEQAPRDVSVSFNFHFDEVFVAFLLPCVEHWLMTSMRTFLPASYFSEDCLCGE
jgi:hypothetical protein